MKGTTQGIFWPVFWVLALGALVTGFIVGSLEFYRWYGSRQEAARREVYEQSKAYNEGIAQELQQMMFEYAKAPAAERAALASAILHTVADYDLDRLPADEQDFVRSLRAQRLGGMP